MTSRTPRTFGTYVRTVRLLRIAQITARIRLRTARTLRSRLGVWYAPLIRRPIPFDGIGWPPGFTPLDRQVPLEHHVPDVIARGQFDLLNTRRELGNPPDWVQGDAEHLWRFHLHYFEWAWCLATHSDNQWARATFQTLWTSWRDACPYGSGDAWAPYVASLRLWVFCGIFRDLVSGSEIEEIFLADMRLHERFIRRNLENDVGGNHLIKNLKAVLGAARFFHLDEHINPVFRLLLRQLSIQILADGGHYERSPSYHCQVLGDFVDLEQLLGPTYISGLEEFRAVIHSMQRWLGEILFPDGDLPLFNDCVTIERSRIRALRPSAPLRQNGVSDLAESGYIVARMGRFHLIVDVGDPCPDELPAHAHADCLSFELAVEGEKTVIDAGTSTYQPGAKRAYERSTAAHNTAVIDGLDQSEMWGTFRVGRRARPMIEAIRATDHEICITAAHSGYSHLRGAPRHIRQWVVTESEFHIMDTIAGSGDHSSVISLRRAQPTSSDRRNSITVSIVGGQIDSNPSEAAVGFGKLIPAIVLTAQQEGPLPHLFHTRIAVDLAKDAPSDG